MQFFNSITLFTTILLFYLVNSNAYSQIFGYANSNGVEIHYQLLGEGFPVLIINGGPGFSSEGFLPLAKYISWGIRP